MGIKKTFWPGVKSDVAQYCRICHVCQIVGKPNQKIPPAPLHPIPVIGEPFERILIDCVGPLPRTKSGNQYLLTIMCAATRFPEAIPLRRITAPVVSKAMITFFLQHSVFQELFRLIRGQILCHVCSPRCCSSCLFSTVFLLPTIQSLREP